jgi:hypothetical protein
LLILGHAWPPKQECDEHSWNRQILQHNGESVPLELRGSSSIYAQTLSSTSSNPAIGPVPWTEVGCARTSGCSPGR